MINDKTVMIYLIKDDKYLMLLRNKKAADMNEGKYIGVGGKIEENETKEEALIREVKEETNLDLHSFSYRGILHFFNDQYSEDIFVFTSSDFSGELIECNEGTLYWISKDKILDLNLWEGDRFFLPYLLDSNDFFEMDLYYKKNILESVKNIKVNNQ